MRPETALWGGAGVVVVVAVLGVVVVPGVVAAPAPEDPEPPGRLTVREVSIAPGSASGATATLALDTRLEHAHGPVENVTVEYRAIDLESGLTETTRRVEVGTVSADGEKRVLANVSVPREGGYRIRTIVYAGAERVDAASTEVRGVGSLQPAYARTGMEFHRFAETGSDLPTIAYRVGEESGDRATLEVWSYLTNAGDEAADGVTLELIARQRESGIVADRARIDVGAVEPGRTVTPGTELTVPKGYNYYLDAILWRDDVVVATARSGASLNPNVSVEVDRNRSEGGLRVGDFVRDDGGTERTPTPRRTTAAGGSGPGFGPLVGVVALLALTAIAALARNHERNGGDSR